MNVQLLLVEPRGHATGKFHRLKADRLRLQSDVQAALARRSPYSVWIAPSKPAMEFPPGTLPRRPKNDDRRLLLLERASGEAMNLAHTTSDSWFPVEMEFDCCQPTS